MSNRERNPSESQVRILFGRSGGQCSYPDCGAVLMAPSQSPSDLPRNVAQVAHITAASPGGPRYDPSLTSEQRRSEANLILLCRTHHDIVDAQLEFHTAQWLQAAKQAHLTGIRRGSRYAMGQVGYQHLQLICSALVIGVTGPQPCSEIELPLDFSVKIDLNALGPSSRESIQLGLAQNAQVRTFLAAMDQLTLGFTGQLTAFFKASYYGTVAEGLRGDEAFEVLVATAWENCGPQLSAPVKAAALAVLTHLFTLCEVFEHELPTS